MTHQGNLAATDGSRRARHRTAAAVACCCSGWPPPAWAAAAAQATSASPGRGSVVSYAKVAHLSLSQARAYLHAAGFDSPTARHGVTIYRIIYRTISSQGKPDTASGVLALPADSQRTLPTVVFEHGTMVAKADAASVAPGSRAEVMLLAGAGYAAVEPDYLGLGRGPGHHPYLDPASEATASVDMLRAARVVAARVHRQLEPKILVTGFSQGGQAALALAHALQHGVGSHLRLGAVAAISGPYDVLHAELPAALRRNAQPQAGSLLPRVLGDGHEQVPPPLRQPEPGIQGPLRQDHADAVRRPAQRPVRSSPPCRPVRSNCSPGGSWRG